MFEIDGSADTILNLKLNQKTCSYSVSRLMQSSCIELAGEPPKEGGWNVLKCKIYEPVPECQYKAEVIFTDSSIPHFEKGGLGGISRKRACPEPELKNSSGACPEPEFVSGSGGISDFYYLRVTQANGQMAWSSPIWVST